MQEFVGLSEIAMIAETSTQTVNNWKRRYKDFPKPIAQVKAGSSMIKSRLSIG